MGNGYWLPHYRVTAFPKTSLRSPASTSTIQVTIGRVEVSLSNFTSSITATHSFQRKRSPSVCLQHYFKQRQGGKS
jgi:hypothetical protein